MPRQLQQLTYNSFSGGLITEASPLTFPDGASIDESNFELTKQGFRKRRLGLDAISDKEEVTSTAAAPKDVITYIWDNNGESGKVLFVVGVRDDILIYDVTNDVPGDNLVYRTTFSGGYSATATSFAAYTGKLIVANGSNVILTITYLGDNNFTEGKSKLKVRDRVGLPDYIRAGNTEVSDLRSANAAGKRPEDNELYLDKPYDAGTSITPPSDITYIVRGSTLVSDNVPIQNGVATRYSLSLGSSNYNYQGYPIEAIIASRLDKSTTGVSYNLEIIFRDAHYTSLIPSSTTLSSFTPFDGGLTYNAGISAATFTNLINGNQNIIVSERNQNTHPHIYNLWNQGWGERRMSTQTADLFPPIQLFVDETGLLPSMADSVNYALYPDNSASSNRTADRFHPADLEANPPGTMAAPRGKYIIDALDRGQSRAIEWIADLDDKDEDRPINFELSRERSRIGATSIAEYAGRIWYAGFGLDDAGSTLPMSNKVLYSQTSDDNLQSCYQQADPTSNVDSDIVETDGGWVNIDAMDQAVKLVPVDTSLLVFATNGVWVVGGLDGNMFSPLSSTVTKITTKGAISAQSIVEVDSDVFFWAEDGAYRIVSGGVGEFSLEPITKGTINSFVLDLSEEDMVGISGAYDERLERIVWIIDGGVGVDQRRELVYHLLYGAFTLNTLNSYADNGTTTEVLSVVKAPPFTSLPRVDNVVVAGAGVIAGADNVVVNSGEKVGKDSRAAYIAFQNDPSGNQVFFADYVRTDFQDWAEVDAEAYMLTGYIHGGDTSRRKDVPQLTVHCNRTETTASLDGVRGESSCLVQSQWEWTDNAFANKWSRPFQAYRLPRPQIRGIDQPVAEGIQVVTTKNKLRGRGRTVSLMFSTEPLKDCQVLGWSMIMGANNNV